MLFKLINGKEKKYSHAGVLEFIAEEGRVYLPQWVTEFQAFNFMCQKKTQTKLHCL